MASDLCCQCSSSVLPVLDIGFLDIQGAYDTVWHQGLVWKLIQMHVPDDLIRWIASFLAPHMAHVHFRSEVASRPWPWASPKAPRFPQSCSWSM